MLPPSLPQRGRLGRQQQSTMGACAKPFSCCLALMETIITVTSAYTLTFSAIAWPANVAAWASSVRRHCCGGSNWHQNQLLYIQGSAHAVSTAATKLQANGRSVQLYSRSHRCTTAATSPGGPRRRM